jgi:hypothetical protein
MNRLFKHLHRSTAQGDAENSNQQTTTGSLEKSFETEVSTGEFGLIKIFNTSSCLCLDSDKPDDKSPPHPTSIFVTTINPDSSITEEKKPITPATPNINEEKSDTKDENNEQEPFKFVPLERKPEYSFIILITSQGQEVLKSMEFLL